MTSIWLLERLWVDPMENNPQGAYGYNVEGYVLTEAEADHLIAEAGCCPKSDCWALSGPTPRLRKTCVVWLKHKRLPP